MGFGGFSASFFQKAARKIADWQSPGAEIRTKQFQARRSATVEAIEPAVVAGALTAAQSAFPGAGTGFGGGGGGAFGGPAFGPQPRPNLEGLQGFSDLSEQDLGIVSELREALRKAGVTPEEFMADIQKARNGDTEARKRVLAIGEPIALRAERETAGPLRGQVTDQGVSGAAPDPEVFRARRELGLPDLPQQFRTPADRAQAVSSQAARAGFLERTGTFAPIEGEFAPPVQGGFAPPSSNPIFAADRAVKEAASRFTGPPGELIGTELAKTAVLLAQPARVAGEALDIPGLRSIPSQDEAAEAVRGAAREVSEEVLNPVNLIPLPVIDPAMARLLGIGGKLLTRTGRRVAAAQAKAIWREASSLLSREPGTPGLTDFVEALGRNIDAALTPGDEVLPLLARAERQATAEVVPSPAEQARRATSAAGDFGDAPARELTDADALEALGVEPRTQAAIDRARRAPDDAGASLEAEANLRIELGKTKGDEPDVVDRVMADLAPSEAPTGALPPARAGDGPTTGPRRIVIDDEAAVANRARNADQPVEQARVERTNSAKRLEGDLDDFAERGSTQGALFVHGDRALTIEWRVSKVFDEYVLTLSSGQKFRGTKAEVAAWITDNLAISTKRHQELFAEMGIRIESEADMAARGAFVAEIDAANSAPYGFNRVDTPSQPTTPLREGAEPAESLFEQVKRERGIAGEAASARLPEEAAAPSPDVAKEFDLQDQLRGRQIEGGAGPQPQAPTGGAIPDLGVDGAERALNLKSETLLRSGGLTQLPGVRQTLGKLQPSVNMERRLLESYNARGAVEADLVTAFSAKRLPLIEAIEREIASNPPTYIGPKSPATDYLIDTPKSIFESPEHYTGISPGLRSAIKAYDDAGTEILNRIRSEYAVDVRPFSVDKPDWTYLATSEAREARDESLESIGSAITSSSISKKASVTKTRLYETAFDRSTRNPRFRAETSLRELTDLHDRAVARLSGNETFRLGVDGKTRLQAMQDTHPELAERMVSLRKQLQSLRGTAGRLNERLGTAIDDFLANPDGARQGTLEGVRSPLADLADSLDVKITRGPRTGANIRAVNERITRVRQEIRSLRPAWEGANLDPWVLNRKTFRYHEAEQSEAIDRLLLTKLPIGEGLLQAIDEVRLTAFAADLSPIPIQIGLGVLADPIAAGRAFTRSLRTLFDPEELVRIAAADPDKISRFTQATQRPFGRVSGEFAQAGRGLERLAIGRTLNDRLFSGVELARYRLWEAGTEFLQKRGGQVQNIADSEAANAGSKIIPGIVSAESGRSVLRAKLERVPVISTSFILSPAGALKDATSGLFKLGTSRALSPAARWQGLAGREQLAIKYLATMAGTIAGISIGSHVLSGWSPEEAAKMVLDPNHPRFMSVALGKKRRIALGGPFRSALKAFLPQKTGEVDGVPIYVPFKGTKQWLQGKITPAISGAVELASNKDYFGSPISTGEFPENLLRSIWFGANQVLPLTVSDPSEAVRTGEVSPTDIGRIAELGGSQFAGTDLRETSLFETFTRAFEEKIGHEFGTGAADRQLAEDDPELAPLRKAVDEQSLRRGFDTAVTRETRAGVLAEEEQGLVPFSQAVIDGTDPNAGERFREKRRSFGAFSAGTAAQAYANFDIEPRSPVGKLVNEYYDIDLDDYLNLDTLETDFAAFEAARQKILDEIAETDPQGAAALEAGGINFTDPANIEAERMYQLARPLVDQLYDDDNLGTFRGIGQEREQEFREFFRLVNEVRDRAELERGTRPSVEATIRGLGRTRGKSQAFVDFAVRIRPGSSSRDALKNIEREIFLLRNHATLSPLYPGFYDSSRMRQALFRLGQSQAPAPSGLRVRQ